MAKEAGCKFTFGVNNGCADGLVGREYRIRPVEDCKLGWQHFFAPGGWGSKAVDRKQGAPRA